MGKRSLKLRFLLITIVSYLLIGGGIFYFAQYKTRDFLITEEKKNFTAEIQAHANQYFSLNLPVSLRTGKYKEYLSSLIIPNASSFRLLDSNGTIIYGENQAKGDLSKTPEIKKVIEGETIIVGLSNPDKAEIFAPIKSGQDVKGIVIATLNLNPTLNAVIPFAGQLSLGLGLISLALIAISYAIFNNAENEMNIISRSLIDKSKALEEEQKLDEAIMSSLSESLVVINREGQVMLFNPEAERITGHKNQDVEYRHFRKLIKFCDKDGKEITKNPISETLHTRKKTQIGIQEGYFVKNVDETLTPVVVSVAPILTGKDYLRGVAVTIQDVTTEKELDKVKDEFVYVVAHELGNPIFALDGYLSILDQKMDKCDKQSKTVLNSARSLNQQLSSLVNDLLEVVRNQSGQITIDTEPVDLGALTKEVVESASFKAKTKKIELKYVSKKIPRVICSQQKIKEVLTNLIDNAIKYTPEKGKVEIWHDIDKAYLTTNIKDNGLGIDEESQKSLFEKFFRVKNTKTQGISGTGLGLFISKQIVEKCGGEIWATSKEGQGSTFSFKLKIAKK